MKVKEARERLDGLLGDSLYQRAADIFRSEAESRIKLRSHNKKPTEGVVDSVVKEMGQWFREVAMGLPWSIEDLPKKIVSWETGELWNRHKLMNPVVKNYRDKIRSNIVRGVPLPAFEPLTNESLEALSSMMMARMKEDMEGLSLHVDFAKSKGMVICAYSAEERHCPHQETYYLPLEGKPLPTNVSELVFLCSVEKCIKVFSK